MKLAIFGVLACSLILANAAYVDPIEESLQALEQHKQALVKKSDIVSSQIERKLNEIIALPYEDVEALITAIEKQKQENEQCGNLQNGDLEYAIQKLESSLDDCTQTASTTSISLTVDILKLITEIAIDTRNLVKNIQRCKGLNNSILKDICYATQVIKAKNIIEKTVKGIKDLTKSVDEKIPQIFMELDSCSAAVKESALVELETINQNIDRCVAKYY